MLNLSGVWVQNGYAGGDGGGAFLIYNPGASLKLSNCIVSNSTTTNPNGGGAILVREGTSATIDNCVFFKNSATNGEGGAINVVATPNNDSSLAVTNSKFFDNESASWGSAIFTVALGVGEAGTITTASTSIDTSEFYDNSAQNPSSGGGAIANWGIAAGANATTSVSNSLVGGNVSTNYSPGGIYNLASNTGTAMMTVTDSSVVANTSPGGEESGMDILSTAESGSTATLNVSNSTVFDCLVSAIGSGSNPGTGCP